MSIKYCTIENEKEICGLRYYLVACPQSKIDHREWIREDLLQDLCSRGEEITVSGQLQREGNTKTAENLCPERYLAVNSDGLFGNYTENVILNRDRSDSTGVQTSTYGPVFERELLAISRDYRATDKFFPHENLFRSERQENYN